MKIGTVLLVGSLLAILAASVWWGWTIWMSSGSEPMPPGLWAALIGGVVFSLLFGCGLMALVFYSNRHGYDDEADGTNQR